MKALRLIFLSGLTIGVLYGLMVKIANMEWAAVQVEQRQTQTPDFPKKVSSLNIRLHPPLKRGRVLESPKESAEMEAPDPSVLMDEFRTMEDLDLRLSIQDLRQRIGRMGYVEKANRGQLESAELRAFAQSMARLEAMQLLQVERHMESLEEFP